MPLEVLGEGFLSAVFRVVFWIFSELLFEVLIKGLGYILCRPFDKDIDPDSWLCLVVGCIAWFLIGWGIYVLV